MLRKIAEIKVPTGAGPREVKTKYVFASYDRQGAAFAFYFSENNIAGTKANLLFVIDGQKVFVDDDVTLSETNETHTFTYPLPDELLNYTGKIDGYLYFDFEDGSHSDEIHFVFTIKKSKIDEEMEDAPDVYIKSFEDVKEQVEQTAYGAKETISQKVTEVSDTTDSAISKVNQVADDTIKNADQAKSDVQSKADEASYSIDEAVKSTESARDEAVKTMTELDYSDRNSLVSDNIVSYDDYNRTPVVEENGRKITTEFVSYRITLKDNSLKPDGKYTLSGRIEINGKPITSGDISSPVINTKHDDSKNERLEVLSDGSFIVTETYDSETDDNWIMHARFDGIEPGDVITFYDLQFQPGSVPTLWQPAFGNYDAKIKKLENAITSLGGSI
ncbi:MAG: phage baseplate upper protein [Tetragenococcus koreensis]|nr:phage baseplate upper protein [Tetragenococcus koreensis]